MNGISFLVRVKNEEKTLQRSIESLQSLSIPHEIVIVLHLCTDRSEEIAENMAKKNDKIKVFKYEHEISRAGYESLATDKTSSHHLVTYNNWCNNKSKYAWNFKWDSDFIASKALIDFLNQSTWSKQNKIYKISCKNDEHINKEPYLTSGLFYYDKYLFWEVLVFSSNSENIALDDDMSILHESFLGEVKSYWFNDPWFLTEESEEAIIVRNRIKKLTDEFGPEPVGMARASNPVCAQIEIAIHTTKPSYVDFYN